MKLTIGSIAPEFAANDCNGRYINLAYLIENGSVILVLRLRHIGRKKTFLLRVFLILMEKSENSMVRNGT